MNLRHKVHKSKIYNFLFDWLEEDNSIKIAYLFFLGFGIFFGTILITVLREFYNPSRDLSQDADVLFLGYSGAGFVTFTHQSNMLLGIAMMSVAWKRNKWTLNFLFATVVWISITFAIYWTLIAPVRSIESWRNASSTITSVTLHVIFPSIGFTILWMFRRHVVVMRVTRIIIPTYLTIYYVLLLGVFFGSLDSPLLASYNPPVGVPRAVLIYSFANPFRPLFVNPRGNNGVLAIMHIFVVILLYTIPLLLTMFWLWVYKINHVKFVIKKNLLNFITKEDKTSKAKGKRNFKISLKDIKFAKRNEVILKY